MLTTSSWPLQKLSACCSPSSLQFVFHLQPTSSYVILSWQMSSRIVTAIKHHGPQAKWWLETWWMQQHIQHQHILFLICLPKVLWWPTAHSGYSCSLNFQCSSTRLIWNLLQTPAETPGGNEDSNFQLLCENTPVLNLSLWEKTP